MSITKEIMNSQKAAKKSDRGNHLMRMTDRRNKSFQ